MASSTYHPLGIQVEIQIQTGSLSGEKRAFCGPKRLILGRHADADIQFSDQDVGVSLRHLELILDVDACTLADLGSTNGTLLFPNRELLRTLALPPAVVPYQVEFGRNGPLCQIQVSNTIPFGAYNVTGQLGKGGMATVFGARQATDLNRLVVLKLIHPDLLHSIDKQKAGVMLIEEAQIVSQISHPNVVNIFDVGVEHGVHYIAMEYLRGITLFEVLQQLNALGRRCPFDLAAALISQACLGLHAAHEACDASGRQLAIVHRDFTPTNLVISPEGDVKLIDFGVARAVGRQHLSKDGQFVGKPAYASPEQILYPNQVTRTSDIFSAAAVLYELCAGRPLFQRDNTHATLFAVIHDPVPTIKGLPSELWELLTAALQKDPATRIQTAAEMGQRLEQIVLKSGGRFLAHRAIADALVQLGVRLRAEPPQPIIGWPAIFPSPDRSKPSTSSTTSRSRRTQTVVLTPPCEITIAGTEYRADSWLTQRARSAERPYATKYLLAHVQARDTGMSQLRDRFVLGFYGGTTELQPLAETQQKRLAAFADRWSRLNDHPDNPLGALWEHGPAWPDGPYYTLTPYYTHTLSSVKAGKFLSDTERNQIARCLCRALASATKLYPGYVHGRLDPACVAFPFREAVIRPAGSTTTDVALLSCDLEWALGIPYNAAPRSPLPPGAYVSPERLRGAAPSPASDVYALGAMLYELYGGKVEQAAAAVLRGAPLPLIDGCYTIPDLIMEAIVATLNPAPERRPQAHDVWRMITEETPNGDALLQVQVPGPAEVVTIGEQRKVAVHAMELSRRDQRAPQLLPFCDVPGLVPGGIEASSFTTGVALDLASPCDAMGQRIRLYEPGDPTGRERLFLSADQGWFEIGNRRQGWLQGIHYLCPRTQQEDLALAGGLSIRLSRKQRNRDDGHVVLYTRDSRTGITHLVSISITQ